MRIKRLSIIALVTAVSVIAEARTKVVFSFDTEDFIRPESADAIRDIANILADEGVRGHFAMVGYLGQKLVEWRRFDVLNALTNHLIGTQTLYHSLHPNLTESTDIEDYGRAREIAMTEECRGIGMLQAATGQDKMWCSVLPGNGNTIAALYLYADLGIPFFCGGSKMYRDALHTGDVWYCNQRHLDYAYNMHLEYFIPNYMGDVDVDKQLDILSAQKVATFYMHPHMAVCKKHWDWVFKGGNNYAFGKWPEAPARDPADTAVFYERLRGFVRKLKSDPRFEITDCERLLAEQKPRRVIVRADVPALREALKDEFGPVRSPGEWCIADVFQSAVAFLKGADRHEPGKVYGFLYRPKGVEIRTTVKAADIRRTAERIDLNTFLPPQFDVGGVKIGPADFLFAALDVLETGSEEIVIEPRDQLGEIAKHLPDMAAASFRGTWIYTPEYKDEWTSCRLRWQFWTFRYE